MFTRCCASREAPEPYNSATDMSPDHQPSAVVAAEGHLIDSHLLTAIFDTVVNRGGAFEVEAFHIGRTNDEFSRLTLKVTTADEATLTSLVEALIPLGCHVDAEHDAAVRPVDRDGCAPEDFHSTTNQRTQVRIGGRWIRGRAAAHGRDDRGRGRPRRLPQAARPARRRSRRLRPRRRPRDAGVPRARPRRLRVHVERYLVRAAGRSGVARIRRDVRATKRTGGRIAFVAGPVVVHTGGAGYFSRLMRAGLVDVLLAGNALAVHDVESALFGTSLGVDLERAAGVGRPSPSHARHQRDQPRRRH